MTDRVLLVDDDAMILAAHRCSLGREFQLETATSSVEAIEKIVKEGPFAVVVSDLQMPRVNGWDFLGVVAEKAPETVRIMLTGNPDRLAAVRALNQGGVFQFLTKPCPAETLAMAIRSGLRQYGMVVAERKVLRHTVNGSVRFLQRLLELGQPELAAEAERIRARAREVSAGQELGSPWRLDLAAALCHVGALGTPVELVGRGLRGEALTEEERRHLARLPELAASMLSHVPRLQEVARVVRFSRRDFSGDGSEAGTTFPLESRVLRVLMDWVAMETAGKTRAEAWAVVRGAAGIYDPAVVEILDRLEAAGPAGEGGEPAPEESVAVHWSDLHCGQLLRADVRTGWGRVLATRGTRVSSSLLARLPEAAASAGVLHPIWIAEETAIVV